MALNRAEAGEGDWRASLGERERRGVAPPQLGNGAAVGVAETGDEIADGRTTVNAGFRSAGPGPVPRNHAEARFPFGELSLLSGSDVA